MIYLDYAANSPVEEEVLNAYYETTKKYFANPNSVHKLGLEAKELLDKSTNNIAKNLNVLPEEIIYTSGATESNNLAVKGICERYKAFGKHILVSSLEHNSIIASATTMQEKGFEVDLIPVNKDGIISVDEIKKLIRDDTILVCVTSIDSEIGIRQPIEEIGKFLKNYPNCYFHTDATQAIGKVDIDLKDVDLATITNDCLDIFIENLQSQAKSNEYLNNLKNQDNYEEIKTALNPRDYNMIVTPKEVDDLIENMKNIVAKSINYAI